MLIHKNKQNSRQLDNLMLLCESIISMAETNGRLEYWIWDSELKQTDVMEGGGGGGILVMLGYPGMCHFPEYTFCLKILERNVNF